MKVLITEDYTAQCAAARFFSRREQVPRYALTMGMEDIMWARRRLLLISGSGKEEAAARLLLGQTVTPRCPATFVRLHRDATVLLTRPLAEKIGYPLP